MIDLHPEPGVLRLADIGEAAPAALLARHAFVLLPSVVSAHSWNLVFDPGMAAGAYALIAQERFALDPRLHPP